MLYAPILIRLGARLSDKSYTYMLDPVPWDSVKSAWHKGPKDGVWKRLLVNATNDHLILAVWFPSTSTAKQLLKRQEKTNASGNSTCTRPADTCGSECDEFLKMQKPSLCHLLHQTTLSDRCIWAVRDDKMESICVTADLQRQARETDLPSTLKKSEQCT